jgi:hypothetical protein
VAVTLFSVDQPSLARPAKGKYGLELSAGAIVVSFCMVVKCDAVLGLSADARE